MEAAITHSADGQRYFFVAHAVGPQWDATEWAFSFAIGELDVLVVIGLYADGLEDVFVGRGGDIRPIPEGDYFVAEGSVSASVPADWLGDFAGDRFDWDVVLEIGELA